MMFLRRKWRRQRRSGRHCNFESPSQSVERREGSVQWDMSEWKSSFMVGVCFKGALAAWMPGLSRFQPTRLGRALGSAITIDHLREQSKVHCSTEVNNGNAFERRSYLLWVRQTCDHVNGQSGPTCHEMCKIMCYPAPMKELCSVSDCLVKRDVSTVS